MGEIDEIYGYRVNFNHPYIEVDDTAVAVIKYKNGAFGQITVSNSQNPTLFSKIIICGSNEATVSVKTKNGGYNIAGKAEKKKFQ